MKSKDNELSKLKEKHLHLLQLVKDNGLDEREKLQKEVEELRFTVNDQNRKLQVLIKKMSFFKLKILKLIYLLL